MPLLPPPTADGPWGALGSSGEEPPRTAEVRSSEVTPVYLVACLHSDVPVPVGLGDCHRLWRGLQGIALAQGNHLGTCSSALSLAVAALAAAWPGLAQGKGVRKKSIG